MVVDDSVTIVVPDSEGDGEGEETLIFNPHDDDNFVAPIEADIVPLDQAARLEPEDLSSEDGKRFLRRRKAIQRMPYSLDRLKHKQLLQGFDVSGFESLSEDLSLPNRSFNVPGNPQSAYIPPYSSRWRDSNNDSHYKDKNAEIEEVDTHSELEVDDSSSEEISRFLQGKDEYDKEEEEQEEEEQEEEEGEEEELVKFRGRLINIKTGFRGVLPRVAWEKAMKQQSSGNRCPKRRRNSTNNNLKGVAKKKHVSIKRNVRQDDSLLNDLIVPDDEVSLDNQTIPLEGGTDKEALYELKQIDQQYQKKYKQQYLSDDNESGDSERDNFIIELGKDQNENEVEIAPKTISSPQNSLNQYDETSDLIEIGAVENDDGVIDRMLSKQLGNKNSKPHNPEKKASKKAIRHNLNQRTLNYRTNQQKKSIRSQNKRELRQKTLPSNLLFSESSSKEQNHLSVPKSTLNQKKQNNNLKNRKSDFAGIGPFAPLGPTNTRRANIFSTVIEAPSNKYALPKHNVLRTESSDLSTVDAINTSEQQRAPISVLDTLFNGTQVHLPDTVSINLQNEQFILSKFHRNDAAHILANIFDHIIDRGITDKELLQISEKITLFLLYFNHLSVLPVVNEFHKRFRSKVGVLKEKAKSIHFYQIAVCQLMFLEIIKYSDIANALRMEIKFSIFNHIVSFFKLLSYCYGSVVKSDFNYLFQSFDILSKIILLLDGNIVLWEKLKEQKFRPEVCFFLTDTFPTSSSYWGILKVEQEYDSLSESFRFVNHCTKRFNWQVNKDLIFLFDNIFKRRRYENFVTEDFRNDGVPSVNSIRKHTMFSNYLSLLQDIELTDLVVERITPMGELSTNDSLSALKNRLDLLIVLARSSKVNLEKRMEDLTRSLLNTEHFSKEGSHSLKGICRLILDSVLSLAEINKIKKLPFRGKILATTFKNLIFEYAELLEGIWATFLNRFIPVIETSAKSRLGFCKEFYFCLVLMSQKDIFTRDLVRTLQFYLKNLALLGVTWTQRNILQLIKNKIHLSANWIDYYCNVGRFLIQSNVISWWSFYMYNDVGDSLTNKFYFDCKVLQMCDNQSFELIKKSMFTTATKFILHPSSNWFLRFLIQLMNRECSAIIEYNFSRQIGDMKQVVKRFLWVLNKLSYNDLLLQFITNLKKSYQKNIVTTDFVVEIVEYLNLRYIDQTKMSHEFFSLKRELGISDIEAEKSAFRDTFKSQKDLVSQACFLECELIHALSSKEEIERFIDKLESLFKFSILEDSFFFFNKLIVVHLQGNFMRYKQRLVIYFLYLINRVLTSRHLQVSSTEFLGLCMLHRAVCLFYPTPEASISPKELDIFRTECLQLQVNVLKIADGFLEFEVLGKMSKKFLENSPLVSELPVSEVFDSELSKKIEDILQNNGTAIQQVNWYFPCGSKVEELELQLSCLIIDLASPERIR